MRIALLLILAGALSVLAVSTIPSVERSAAVFVGKVLSVQKVRVVGKDDISRWELWKAEVKLQTVVTQDITLPERIFVYYAQDWSTNYVTEDGRHVSLSAMVCCPPRPRIDTNGRYKFFCIRCDGDGDERVLFIPEGGWVIRQ